MKKKYICAFLLINILLILSSNAQANFNECRSPLKLSLVEKWRPYIYLDQENNTKGADVSLLQTLLQKMGCKIEITHFPEKRMLPALKKGKLSVALGISKTPERSKAFHYSNPYRFERNKFAFRTADQQINQAKDLDGVMALEKVIAINMAGWYGDEIETAKKNYDFFLYGDTATKRLEMLKLARVDIVIDDEIVLCHELVAHDFKGFSIHPYLLSEGEVHFVFNKDIISQKFMAKFNQLLEQIRTSGALREHYKKHLSNHCT